jgi:hypothetical protein
VPPQNFNNMAPSQNNNMPPPQNFNNNPYYQQVHYDPLLMLLITCPTWQNKIDSMAKASCFTTKVIQFRKAVTGET